MAKLTSSMRNALGVLARNEAADFSDEASVKALARRGLAQRDVQSAGHCSFRHRWIITDKGREALASGRK